MRLFVDAESLIHWEPQPVSEVGSYQTQWVPNKLLISELAKRLAADEELVLYVWSNDGKSSAAMTAQRVIPQLPWIALTKDVEILQQEDEYLANKSTG